MLRPIRVEGLTSKVARWGLIAGFLGAGLLGVGCGDAPSRDLCTRVGVKLLEYMTATAPVPKDMRAARDALTQWRRRLERDGTFDRLVDSCRKTMSTESAECVAASQDEAAAAACLKP